MSEEQEHPGDAPATPGLISLKDYNEEARKLYTGMRSAENKPRPNEIACPECGAELLDADPSMQLSSYPPQLTVKCAKCDYTGYRVVGPHGSTFVKQPAPVVTSRGGVLGMQVCVPRDWSDERVREFANSENICGTTSGWQICRQGSRMLGSDPERAACGQREGFVHIMLDA